jgi:2-oxoglutarate dehydrogenase E2 component (dihydrolipoamide succinyltransferase)
MSLVLACDHRAVDGAYGAGFLKRVKELLEAQPWEDEGLGRKGKS